MYAVRGSVAAVTRCLRASLLALWIGHAATTWAGPVKVPVPVGGSLTITAVYPVTGATIVAVIDDNGPRDSADITGLIIFVIPDENAAKIRLQYVDGITDKPVDMQLTFGLNTLLSFEPFDMPALVSGDNATALIVDIDFPAFVAGGSQLARGLSFNVVSGAANNVDRKSTRLNSSHQ